MIIDMPTFKRHFLMEKIEKSDIIDLYIIMAMPRPDDPANQFIIDEVINRTRANIENEVQSIILRELRHLGDATNIIDQLSGHYNTINPKTFARRVFETDMDHVELITKMKKSIYALGAKYGDEGSSKYNKSEMSFNELSAKSGLPWDAGSIEKVFRPPVIWDSSYGGNNWSKLTKEAGKLLAASNGEFLKQLDRFVDFVHNNGAVLDKFKGYKEGWLQFILDIKAKELNMNRLRPLASKDIQKMLRADTAWRNFMRQHFSRGAQDDPNTAGIDNLLMKYIMNPDDEQPEKDFESILNHYGEAAFGESLIRLYQTPKHKRYVANFIEDAIDFDYGKIVRSALKRIIKTRKDVFEAFN